MQLYFSKAFATDQDHHAKRVFTLSFCVLLLQRAGLVPTKLQPQMPTAPNVLLTARPHRNKPRSAFVKRATTEQRPTHARWPAHVSLIS